MTMKPMYPAVINSPGTELAADITSSATEITVLSALGLPSAPNLLTIGSDETAETVRYTKVDGTKLSVERAFQGVAKSWSTGTKVARYFTAYDHDTFMGNIGDLDARLSNTSYLVYFVDAANGDDTNDGLSKMSAFKTITKAVNMIEGVTLTRVSITLLPGVYDEDVKIENRLRCQTIELKGETTSADLYQVSSITINNVTNRVGISNIEITTTTTTGISIVYCNRTSIENVLIRANAPSQHGISSYDGNAHIINCHISNRNAAIAADTRSYFYCANCTGTGNKIGILSQFGSILCVNGTIPQGLTAEYIAGSGQVFGNTPFAYFRSGELSVTANSVPVDIPLTTVVEDSYGLKKGDSILINKNGWYHLNMLLTLQSLPSGKMADIRCYKNGSGVHYTNRQAMGFGTDYVTYLTLDDQQYFNKGDVVNFQCSQDSNTPVIAYNTQVRITFIGQKKT
ncbi:hypothetical protein M5X06_12965 [Paenibacillus alvei]|uniref:Uncharacterized protein n=1 Tax=Paenibacillus alvei TaxID=44250 RepID=A0ABT4GUQ5_PAEAL|nr:hypothetical protein [Paenibacillus alvei]MCY9760432.1 hypothetical protein [Paenibacillus alvei]MCY9767724.1 hypothetical protein [Paenibacillus alvei]